MQRNNHRQKIILQISSFLISRAFRRTTSIWPKPTMTTIQLYSISFFGLVLSSYSHCMLSAMPLPPWTRVEIRSSIVWRLRESRKTTNHIPYVQHAFAFKNAHKPFTILLLSKLCENSKINNHLKSLAVGLSFHGAIIFDCFAKTSHRCKNFRFEHHCCAAVKNKTV